MYCTYAQHMPTFEPPTVHKYWAKEDYRSHKLADNRIIPVHYKYNNNNMLEYA